MAYRGKKREPELQQAAVPGVDWLVVGLAGAGFLVAGYLTWLKWANRGAFLCVAGSGCDLVQASRYSIFLGVPTALWGAVLYVAIGVLGGLGLTTSRWMAAFLVAAGGVGFSAYLTALSFFVLGGACVYCLASAAHRGGLARHAPLAPPARPRPQIAPAPDPAGELRNPGGRCDRCLGRLRIRGAFVSPSRLSVRTRAPSQADGCDHVWRLLVTGVQGAKGPVRACRGGVAIRGVRPEGHQSPSGPLPADRREGLPYMGRQQRAS